jgi:dienelactone hydrolase
MPALTLFFIPSLVFNRMNIMRLLLTLAIFFAPLPLLAADPDPSRVFPSGQKCPDSRLGKPKNLNGYFPFTPPKTKDGWDDRARQLREQILVATGLWPMPEKTPLNAVIHGKIERDGYTIEKVYFASMPGHYVTGNLYRPTAKIEGKRPGALTPHGHWPPEGPKGGRFYEASDAEVKRDLASGAEKTAEGARYPLQARCAGLARMGFVVFHYDMVGYADSQAITHRTGFLDADAELRSQNFMGLQTWNSIRALDFLSSLDDVDPKRLAMTGASGGGTQTFMLGAIDDRLMTIFPAVMVSTAMQGGCVCENCSYLRIGTGNVEIAGLFAPKPLGMSAANDWTVAMESKGLPELKQLYRLYGAEDMVALGSWLQFGHNYSQPSREFMFNWFNRHVFKQTNVIKEEPFKPVPPSELSVYDDKHPRPKDELNALGLRETMTAAAEKQMKALEPRDEKTLAEYRRIIGSALRAMIHESSSKSDEVEVKSIPDGEALVDGAKVSRFTIGRLGAGEAVPTIQVGGTESSGTTVLWLHPKGKASLFASGKLAPAAKEILDKKAEIVAVDVFQTGELKLDMPFPVDAKFAGFTYGYNSPVFAQRVDDILTAVRFAKARPNCKKLVVVGWEEAGPWVAAARALAGDSVARTAIDMNQFRFENLKSTADENMLPGAVKFGGLAAFLALCAPHEVLVHNHSGTGIGQLSKAAYDAAGAKDKLIRSPKMKEADIVEWLLK